MARLAYARVLRPPRFHLVAAVDKDPKIAHDFCKRFRVREKFTDLDALQRKVKDIDGVVICVPSDLHYALSMRAFSFGWNVFCEKPIALSVRHAQRMVGEARKRKLVLQVGHVLRFQPEYACAHGLIRSGILDGKVAARTRRIATFANTANNWYLDERRSGGVLVDLAIHDIDFLLWTLGPVRRVSANVARFDKTTREIAVITSILFENESTAEILSEWSLSSGFHYGFEFHSGQNKLSYSYPQKTLALVFTKFVRHLKIEKSNPYTDQIEDFYGQVEGLDSRSCRPLDAVDALRVSLAARRCIENEARTMALN
jgi:predicted dehydrogenase